MGRSCSPTRPTPHSSTSPDPATTPPTPTLWTRHASAAGRLARQFRGDWDADDLVSEAYTRVLDLVRRGRGPTDAFRPYLFAVVRNVAQAWSKKVADPVDDFDAYADPVTEHDPAIRSLESSLTRRAFEALPERQRAVLWYTEVEGMTPQQISPLLGMTPNSVSALAYRARESLRTEWIQAHLHQAATSADCEWTLSRLGDYTRDHLTARNLQRAEAHLANCASCARAKAELKDVGSALAIAILAPVVGMGAGLGYLAGTGAAPAVAGGAGGLVAFGTAAAPTTIGSVGSAALASAAALAIIGAAVVSAVLPPAEAAESAPVAIGEETSSVDPFGDAIEPSAPSGPLAPPESPPSPGAPSAPPPADAGPQPPAPPSVRDDDRRELGAPLLRRQR